MSTCFDANDHFVLICTKCCGAGAAGLLGAKLAADLPTGFAIRAVDCMAGCEHPPVVGFQAAGKATYLFGKISGSVDVSAILEFSHQYKQSENGWTSAGERPMALYEKTVARIPALKSAGRP